MNDLYRDFLDDKLTKLDERLVDIKNRILSINVINKVKDGTKHE